MEDKRKYNRYDTEMRVFFDTGYDLKTKVDFKVVDADKILEEHKKYSGLSRNISAEGMCFASTQQLKKGDKLYLEVYMPNAKNAIFMDGEVKWSEKASQDSESEDIFYTGVVVTVVDGKPVSDSICSDPKYKITWSIVLESAFGSFQDMLSRFKEEKPTDT